MELDSMVGDEANTELKGVFMEPQTYSEIQKTKMLIERKPDQSLICSRCHQLKSQNTLLSYKAPEKPQAGQAVQLSDHVA